VLNERGYRITSVAGCSIGAIVGGMCAAGKMQELKHFFLDIDRLRMLRLTDFSVTTSHLVKGDRLVEAFGEIIPDTRIEDLPVPLALVATDVLTGREHVFRSGDLNTAIRASFSLPVVLRPVEHEGMLLMDGGLTNPLPLNRVRRTGNDLLVSLNVSAPIEQEPPAPGWERPSLMDKLERLIGRRLHDDEENQTGISGYADILSRVSDIMLVQNAELVKSICPPDISMDIPINRFGSYDYDHAGELIAYGRTLMSAALDRYEASLY
jgi:NTE family protein